MYSVCALRSLVCKCVLILWPDLYPTSLLLPEFICIFWINRHELFYSFITLIVSCLAGCWLIVFIFCVLLRSRGRKHSVILRTQLTVRVHACIGEYGALRQTRNTFVSLRHQQLLVCLLIFLI